MAVNKGIAPPNFETDVGKFRAVVGDTFFEDLKPVETGFGDYSLFSDGEIEAYLGTNDSFEGAVAAGYLALATSAALQAKTVKDFDLQVSTEKRAGELRALAQIWLDKADALTADIFEVYDTKINTDNPFPELAARPWL